MLSLRLGLNKWQRREPPFRNLPRSRESERTYYLRFTITSEKKPLKERKTGWGVAG